VGASNRGTKQPEFLPGTQHASASPSTVASAACGPPGAAESGPHVPVGGEVSRCRESGVPSRAVGPERRVYVEDEPQERHTEAIKHRARRRRQSLHGSVTREQASTQGWQKW
jgi:hypothetical protein